jgi:phosphate transport system substrate-binding protein
MTYLRRSFGLALAAMTLLATLAPNAAILSHAQDTSTVTIDGSSIMSPLLKYATDVYKNKHAGANITVNVSGTDVGFQKLCAGSIDMAMAARSMNDTETAACGQNKVSYIELVLGYDALLVVVNNASTLTCISSDQLSKLLSPGASGGKNWNAVDSSLGNVPISNVYAPPADSQAYVLADSIVPGDKLRGDIKTVDDGSKVADQVGGDPAGVGILTLVNYQDAQSRQLPLKSLQLKSTTECVDPSVANIEAARYPAAETLYLYVNAASLDRSAVLDFSNDLMGGGAQSAATVSNFAPASQTTYDRGTNYLKIRQTGPTFSRIQSVNVPADTVGTITTDGSPDVFPVIKSISDAFSPRYTKITFTSSAAGDDKAYSRFCTNGVDMIGVTRLPTDDEKALCQKAQVDMIQLLLGNQAVVVVVNNNNKFATCLTTDQIWTLFGVDSEGKVKKWSDVSSDFPATDILIVAPTDGAAETDMLLDKSVKKVAPIRRADTTDNDDPNYRAGGTQNVDGAVTYMNFADFQKVKANVHALAINAGNGCINPTAATVKDGSYPISESLYAILNTGTFARPDMKAWSWYFLSDDALATLAQQNLVNTDTQGIVTARDVALAKFTQAPVAGATQQVGGPAATANAAPADIPPAAASQQAP